MTEFELVGKVQGRYLPLHLEEEDCTVVIQHYLRVFASSHHHRSMHKNPQKTAQNW